MLSDIPSSSNNVVVILNTTYTSRTLSDRDAMVSFAPQARRSLSSFAGFEDTLEKARACQTFGVHTLDAGGRGYGLGSVSRSEAKI